MFLHPWCRADRHSAGVGEVSIRPACGHPLHLLPYFLADPFRRARFPGVASPPPQAPSPLSSSACRWGRPLDALCAQFPGCWADEVLLESAAARVQRGGIRGLVTWICHLVGLQTRDDLKWSWMGCRCSMARSSPSIAPAARGCGDGARSWLRPGHWLCPGHWPCRCWNNEGVLVQIFPHLQVVRSWGATGVPADLGGRGIFLSKHAFVFPFLSLVASAGVAVSLTPLGHDRPGCGFALENAAVRICRGQSDHQHFRARPRHH